MSDRSTLVESDEVVRRARDESLAAAMEQMADSLTLELDRFQERVKDDPTVAKTEWKTGSGGGGAVSWLLLLLLVGIRRGRA
jgi:rhombotail lipoprotein